MAALLATDIQTHTHSHSHIRLYYYYYTTLFIPSFVQITLLSIGYLFSSIDFLHALFDSFLPLSSSCYGLGLGLGFSCCGCCLHCNSWGADFSSTFWEFNVYSNRCESRNLYGDVPISQYYYWTFNIQLELFMWLLNLRHTS